ncbi:MAG: hypothetical protein PHQ66_01425 [Candidatus Nanoarchaeia archaeon]|nr:hypothetical protein [Candidatus Nanoarchaeia archaeon]MDD5357963.1 hypothetical protein [Candidatus Nanoarchaeia archaeon]MDD5588882.1 hypothetical protein [Candidatus Nanoarchaeia archaeon]
MTTLDDSFNYKLCECGNYVEDVSSPIDSLPICRNCRGLHKFYYNSMKKEYEENLKKKNDNRKNC